MTTLSKLWLFVVTLAGGLLLLTLLALLPELQRARREDEQRGLQLAQGTARLLLSEQAQRLVAAATQLASDAVLQTTLEEMARGQAELGVLHTTAQKQLQRLGDDKALGASFLLVTDARGRVLARLGQDEAVYRDALDGWPLVSDALRGYRLDDLWLWQGTLYRVAAAPVISAGRDRYVGALLVAQVVGNDLARTLLQLSSLDAVFLCAGQVVGSSLPADRLPVAELLALRAAGAPDRVTVWPGRGDPVAFVELPGTAANQGAALALIGRSRTGTSAWELLRGAAARGLPARLLLALIAGMAVVFLATLLLLRLEVEAPLERLARAGQQALGDKTAVAPRLPETGLSGPLRQLVHTLNEGLATLAARASSTPPPPARAPAFDSAAPAITVGAMTSPGMLVVPPPAATAVPTPMPTVHSEETRVADSNATGDDLQSAYYRVYQEFVLARERCHESVEGLNFDLFQQRLQQSREQIIRQHGCSTVHFQVHVKEGRAMLRATPIWR